MVVSPVAMLIRNLGTHTVVNEISKKEKFLRKKYIGVFKWTFVSVSIMMAMFPLTLSKYVMNIKKNIMACNSGSFVSPRRMNSPTEVLFGMLTFWILTVLYVKRRLNVNWWCISKLFVVFMYYLKNFNRHFQ